VRLTDAASDLNRKDRMRGIRQSTGKTIVIVGIMIPIALLHFLTGSDYSGPYPEFVNGYLIDILLPFGLYFLLCLDRVPIKSWIVKVALVFGVGASVEIAQFFGVPLLGRTFDPLDLVMYAIGVTLAAILDMLVFPKTLRFWKLDV
jgi:glycopeptide antibiotics resistance protein